MPLLKLLFREFNRPILRMYVCLFTFVESTICIEVCHKLVHLTFNIERKFVRDDSRMVYIHLTIEPSRLGGAGIGIIFRYHVNVLITKISRHELI